MIKYGKRKQAHKIHPHNECGICAADCDCDSKKRERQKAKKQIEKEIVDMEEYP